MTALQFFLKIFQAPPVSIGGGGGTFSFSFATYTFLTAVMMNDRNYIRGNAQTQVISLMFGNTR